MFLVLAPAVSALSATTYPQDFNVSAGENYSFRVVGHADSPARVVVEVPEGWRRFSDSTSLSEGEKVVLKGADEPLPARRLGFTVQVPRDAEGGYRPTVSVMAESPGSEDGSLSVGSRVELGQTVRVDGAEGLGIFGRVLDRVLEYAGAVPVFFEKLADFFL